MMMMTFVSSVPQFMMPLSSSYYVLTICVHVLRFLCPHHSDVLATDVISAILCSLANKCKVCPPTCQRDEAPKVRDGQSAVKYKSTSEDSRRVRDMTTGNTDTRGAMHVAQISVGGAVVGPPDPMPLMLSARQPTGCVLPAAHRIASWSRGWHNKNRHEAAALCILRPVKRFLVRRFYPFRYLSLRRIVLRDGLCVRNGRSEERVVGARDLSTVRDKRLCSTVGCHSQVPYRARSHHRTTRADRWGGGLRTHRRTRSDKCLTVVRR